MRRTLQFLQDIGRSLMLPIAVMPITALLLRFGQNDIAAIFGIHPDENGKTVLSALADAGGSIFANLALVFAVGVAIGFSKKYKEIAALAALVGFMVARAVLVNFKVFETDAKVNGQFIIGGIAIGIISGYLSDRFAKVELPKFLGFFSGRRLVPIVSSLVSLVLGYAFVIIWPPIQHVIDSFGNFMVSSGNWGLFLYGFVNRLLIVTGLHNILNVLVWFNFGSFTDSAGKIITGDLSRYFAGDKTAGAFMAGFFPVMMFGLVGAACAIIVNAKKERRAEVSGILISAALTAFLTGITEPIEFAFMFIAPFLYAIHAVLTGLSLVICNVLNVKHGFGFSAGLTDYILNYKYSTNGWVIIPIGFVYFLLYFVLFSISIKFFNIKTQGREDDVKDKSADQVSSSGKSEEKAQRILKALGGYENISSIDACVTRLRVEVKDSSKVEKEVLKAISGNDIVSPTDKSVQVILGPEAEIISDILKENK